MDETFLPSGELCIHWSLGGLVDSHQIDRVQVVPTPYFFGFASAIGFRLPTFPRVVLHLFLISCRIGSATKPLWHNTRQQRCNGW